jgi:hypothetical protein
VKELYDYQKDYFLGSKSQVTLYKGHLGVGVTEPSGQLELTGDERIQEYPPRGMTGYETLVEGHGVFCAYASSVRSSSWEAWEAFDRVLETNTSSRWISNDTYTGTEDAYSGSARLYSSAPLGEYVVLKMPYPIKLNKARVYALSGSPNSNNNRQGPERGQIWGSNDGVTWEHVTNYDFGDYQQEQWNEINNINSMKYYSQYGFIVTKKLNNTYTASGAGQGDYVAITEIQYFGTPGPTTLDKGSLTLGRSLDVPRVSRYDVDTETPRPEKLVVDFDTTVNSSPTDISGKGNHGAFYGTNMNYSSADEAFVFNGTNDYIKAQTGFSGNQSHTVSLWFNPDVVDANQNMLCFISSNGGTNLGRSIVYFNSGAGTVFDFRSKSIKSTTLPVAGQWMHLLCTYDSNGATKMYMNGILKTDITEVNASGTINLVNGYLTIGNNHSGSEAFDGKISNFKIYNVALEPSEVKKLYNLGRTGRSMVISDTAVGIGKVPEAQLDVRGNLNVDGVIKSNSPAFSAYEYDGYTSTGGNTYVTLGNTFVNKGGCYDTSNGIFTAPISGTYRFTVDATIRSPGNTGGGGGTGATTITLHINNANWNPTSTGRPLIYQVIDPGTNHQHVSGSLVWNLTAGDTVRIYLPTVKSGTDINWGTGYGRFIGYLIS